MRLKRLYLIVVCAASITALSACILFLSASYEDIIRLIITISKKPYLENLLRTQVFPENKYVLARYVCIATLLIIPLCAALLLRYQQRIMDLFSFAFSSVQQGYKKVKQVYQQNSKMQNTSIIVLLALIAARSLYYIVQFDLQYDEMWSYNYFTAQPLYYSFVVCSNYPLYEISTGIFKYLPFDMRINIRLPVFIAGLLSCIVLYACLKAYFKHHVTALGGMIVFACMPVTTFYMLYARGVMFALFFAIVSIFSVLFWLRNKQQTTYLVVYAIASAAGVYSMPTNVYLCLILFLLTLSASPIKGKSHILPFFLANTAAGLLSLLLYAPILVGSGVSFLYNAAVDTTSPRPSLNDIFNYHLSVSPFFTGYTAVLLVLIMIVLIAIAVSKQLQQYWFIFSLCCCLYLLPVIIYFFQNVQLPLRSIAFVGLIIPLLYSIIIFSIREAPHPLLVFFIILTGLGAGYISHKHEYLNWSRQLDTQVKELAYLLMQHQVSTCYANSTGTDLFYDYPAIEYYYKINNRPFTLTVAEQNSLRYKPFTVTDNYDCIINHLSDKTPDNYHEIYRDKDRNFKVLVAAK